MDAQTALNAKAERIYLRVSKAQKAVIASAAAAQHKGVTEFILDSIMRQAEETILDQRLFILSNEDFEDLENQLAKPAKANPKLETLLKSK